MALTPRAGAGCVLVGMLVQEHVRSGLRCTRRTALSLPPTPRSEAGTAVVWKGILEDLRARDPRLSNSLYSSLLEPRSAHGSPVVLKFRFSKQRGERVSGEGPASTAPCLASPARPTPDSPARASGSAAFKWESSLLSLDFSEARLVHFQPLSLEAVDYLWEGVLGPAVWGGAVNPQASAVDGGGQGHGNKQADMGSPAGATGGAGATGIRSSSEIHVTLAAPVVVVPGELGDPLHLVLQPASLEYSTWTGGIDDR